MFAHPRTRIRHVRLRLLVLLAALVTATAACQFAPTSYGPARFHDCKITYYDETGTMRPYLDEVTSFTGMRFVPTTRSDAEKSGLLVTRLISRDPYLGGTTQVTNYVRDDRGRMVVWSAHITLVRGASPGLHRHELGHLFNLDHNSASRLMRPTPDPAGTYSGLERVTMRTMAQQSTCSRATFGRSGPMHAETEPRR